MRKVAVIGSAAVLALATALPARAVITDSKLDISDSGVAGLESVDEGVDPEVRPTGPTPAGPTSGPTSGPSAQRPASVPAKPLTAEQKRRLAAGSDACRGASGVLGSAPDVCQPADAGPQIVPAGQPARPRVTATQVRERAVDQIRMTKPEIGASPCLADAANCTGTVGVPVWLWVGDGNGELPSDSAEATAGPFTIRATAKVSEVKWSLGDGQSTVCSGTGTAFNADEHGWSAPDCGFKSGWKKAGTYTLTASYVWDLSWSGDQTGSTTQTMTSTQQITVREIQTVVSGHED